MKKSRRTFIKFLSALWPLSFVAKSLGFENRLDEKKDLPVSFTRYWDDKGNWENETPPRTCGYVLFGGKPDRDFRESL